MKSISIYLNFNGNTEEAFNFYKEVFGGEFSEVHRFESTPDSENLSESDKKKLMHITLTLPNGNVLMATDALESMGQKLNVGNNFYISVNPDSESEADELFAKLSEGGKIEVPLQKMFWNAYYGSLTDKFGVQWMINYSLN